VGWKPIALVAAAGLAVVIGLNMRKDNPRIAAERDAPVTRREVSVIAPADGMKLGGDRLLVWHSVASGATYRVTIGDDQAQPIYSTTVQDTVLVIPSSIAARQGQKFVWYVDAMRSDGVTATSGARAFIIE
jgi:hypothetical protein